MTNPTINTKKSKGEPFLMYLRTALWDRLKGRGNGAYWILEGVDPLGETPFEVHYSRSRSGIRIKHTQSSTSFEILDDSSESFTILEDAIDSLKEANHEKPTLDGAPRESQYELSFDLHIENESQLITMVSFADAAGLEISNYYLNGVLIDPEVIIKMREAVAKATSRTSQGPTNEEPVNIVEMPDPSIFQPKRSPFPALEYQDNNLDARFWRRLGL